MDHGVESLDKLHSFSTKEKEEAFSEYEIPAQSATKADVAELEDLCAAEEDQETQPFLLCSVASGCPEEEVLVAMEACHEPSLARPGHGWSCLAPLGHMPAEESES